MIPRRKIKPLEALVESIPGFKLIKVTSSKRNSHLCCHIEDNEGNRFRIWTGSTSSDRRRYQNLKSDIKKMSQRAKGILSSSY